MVEFSGRLKQAIDARGVTVTELARGMGVTYQAVKRVLDGLSKSFSAENNAKAAAFLQVSPDWLATGVGEMELSRTEPKEIDLENNPDYPAIRRVKFKLSASVSGFGIDYQDDIGSPLFFPKEWYEKRGLKPKDLLATTIINGSMEPGLYDGDTVIVNTAKSEPKDGTVFAVNYEGDLVVKRLIRDDGQWWLSSDNPDQRRYPRKVCHEGVKLIGEIVHKQSERI
ncbi:XRE family transcriptional regulator [uncultured Delftia sp.]|uniref:LexA family transcriptional regulator n=1 Tax=uncultured Delftia sp. TaxID=191464 RepID=UPI002593192D|nr:XRE family transcriptional regulator [uncultured Delftia sp.]